MEPGRAPKNNEASFTVCLHFRLYSECDLTILPSPSNRGIPNLVPATRFAILCPMTRHTRVALGIAYFGVWLAFSAPAGAAPSDLPVFRPNDPVTRSGFERFYNMDYERAIADMGRWRRCIVMTPTPLTTWPIHI